MQSQEKLGLGVAVLVTVGLFGALVFTRPDVPDSPVVSTAALAGTGEQVQVITRGDAIEIAPFLRPGKRTVVEFTAKW